MGVGQPGKMLLERMAVPVRDRLHKGYFAAWRLIGNGIDHAHQGSNSDSSADEDQMVVGMVQGEITCRR